MMSDRKMWIFWIFSLPVFCYADLVRDFTVDEGVSPGHLIGTISSSSHDEFPPPPYIIMGYQDSVDRDLFINENTGEIKARVRFNREITDFYSFMAVPLVGGQNIRVKIAVQDINDHSPTFKTSQVDIEFSESQPRDTRRSLPPAYDPDVGINTTQRYEIISGNINQVFRLSSRRGRDGTLYLDLEINGILDRETIDTYLLVIEAYDGGSPPRTGQLTVNITLLDDNDNQPLFSESRYYSSVPENATVGTVLLKVQATDTDAGRNGEVAYFINRRLSDSEHVFNVDAQSGVVTLNKPLNYEERAVYELVVSARDNGTQILESSTFVYIDVVNINDQPPKIDMMFLFNGSGAVGEDVPVGEFVARISVTDGDAASSGIVLNMTGDGDKFDLVSESGSVFLLRVKNRLDFEEQNNFSLVLIASDGGQSPLTSEKQVKIFVQDVNDNKPVFDKLVYDVQTGESVEKGSVLVHLTATDKDSGENGQLEFFLPEQKSPKVRIDPKTGMLFAEKSWNCEDEEVLEIPVGVRDYGRPSLSSTAVVRISFRSDEDALPVYEENFYNVSLRLEDVQVGSCFLKLQANGSRCGGAGKIHYTFHASWTDDYFRIDPNTGQICVLRSLDHVHAPVRQIIVRATGHGNATTTAFVQIHLPPATIFKSRYFITDIFHAVIYNSTPIGSPVVQLKPDGPPHQDTLDLNFAYTITAGNDNQLFQIDAASGLIQVVKSLHDHVGEHKLEVDVKEISTKLTVVQFQVLVKVDSQVPYFAGKLYKFRIGEDVSIRSFVGTVQALPQYAGNVRFSLGAAGSSFFEVDANSGVLRTVAFLDREAQEFHSVEVVARVPGQPGQDSCQVIISIDDVDDNAPSFPSSQAELHVPENTATGAVIFQAIASDKDSVHRRSLSYRIISGSGEYFRLDSQTGLLTVNKPLDYETTSLHEIVIEAVELNAASSKRATMRVRINVLDSNDHSPIFEESNYDVRVQESAALDTVVMKVQAKDGDHGKNGRLTYQIDGTSDAGQIFGVRPESGEIYLRQKLDRETRGSYTFWVHAIDAGQPPFRAVTTIRVAVLDDNDNAPVFSQIEYNFTVTENNGADAFVGKISATDKDLGDNGFVAYEVKCNGIELRTDKDTGEIWLKESLDREETAVHSCVASARDMGKPVQDTIVPLLIRVLDVNDHAPVFVVPVDEAVWVSEGEPEGTEVIRVIAKDSDEGDNGRLTFSLLPSEDSRAFSIHPTSGTIRSQIVLDHEKQPIYHLTLVATDHGTPSQSSQKSLTINVADVNDHRPTFAASVMTIEITEGTPAGTEIGSVQATDSDSGENGRVTYSIVRGNVFGAFEIGRTSGKLYTAREVDYELAPSFLLRVRAVDNSSQKPRSNLLVVNIIVIDINDSTPKFSTDTCLFSVKENIALGTTVWNVTATDADSGSFGQVLYEIPYQFPQAVFKIHPVTGVVTVGEKIDFERHKEYNFVVMASDRDPMKTRRKSCSLKCNVVIEDENDYAPKFVSRNYVRISERVDEGYPVTQMVALDEDSFRNGKVTYEIARGNEDQVFALDPDTGMISVNRSYGTLKARTYSLTIVATDNGTPRLATMHSITIEIDPVNSNMHIFNQTLYEVYLKEDLDVGTSILKFEGEGATNNTVRFTIPEEFLHEKFSVNPHTGEMTIAQQLDREKKDLYTMNVYATNIQNPAQYDFATIVIEILDVNDNAPVFQNSCHGITIPENKEFGPIHKFIASDADLENNGRISYRIESGNEDQKFFINPNNGELSAKTFDREDQDEYTLVVAAEDHGKPSKQSVCRIHVAVLDQNDNAPVFISEGYTVHITEDVPVGSQVIQIRATDKDSGDNSRVTYSLRNDTKGLLSIDENTGLIVTARSFDYEELTNYTVEGAASDCNKLRPQVTKTVVHILVDDVNDNDPEFSKYLYQLKVAEPVYSGQQIAKVSAQDRDSGFNSAVQYSFAAPQPKFDIDEKTGFVTARQRLDNTGAAYRIPVIAKDQGSSQRSSLGMLDIMVGDAPAAAAELKFSQSSYTASLAENSRIGTIVTTAKASRTDGKSTEAVYSIVDGNNSGVFQIDKRTGTVTVRDNRELDYERWHSFNLTLSVETTGSDRLQAFAKLTVTLMDENDNAPRCAQNKYAASVYEGNQKGTYVTQMNALDEDSGSSGFATFEFSEGNHDGAFVIDPPFSGFVKTNMILDREIHDVYRLTVLVKDAGKPQKTGTCTLKITIIDVNDNEPVFPSFDKIFVSEGTSVGSPIFTAAANDVDVGTEISYSLPNSGNGTFNIDSRTGRITVVSPLDREVRSQYRLTVEAFDQVHRARTNLTVVVKDENDNAPAFGRSDYKISVPEMTPAGTKILTVTAKDADEESNAKIRYAIKIAPVDGFAVDEKTGAVTTTKPVIFDPMHPLIHLVLIAEDSGSPKLSSIAALQIQITSVNRNAPVFSRSVYSVHVPENVPMGQEILQVSAHDPDAEKDTQSVTYSLQGDSEGNFQLDTQSGRLIVLKRLDRETAATYSLKVVASDLEKPVRNATAEVLINVDDVNDCAPQFNQTEYKAFISEDVKKGTVVLQVKAVDFDSGENATVSYSIVSGNEENLFQINPASGTIEVAGTLDYDNISEYKLLVQAKDHGTVTPQSSVTAVTVYLQDANDNAPKFPVGYYKESIPENSPVGTEVFTARAHDQDRGIHGKLRYSITAGDCADQFQIDHTTGKVTTKADLDYEKKQVCNFVVTASDMAGSRDDVQVTINIESRDEFDPNFSQPQYRFFISPDSKKGDFVGQVLADDKDAGSDGKVTYRFQRPSEIFTIDPATGVIALLLDLQIDNSTSTKNSPKPEDSTLVVASSGKEDSRTGAALVTVVFGSPDFEPSTVSVSSTLIVGIVVGITAIGLMICIGIGLFCIRRKSKKSARNLSAPFNVLHYSPYDENGGRMLDGIANHYHDPGVIPAGVSEVSSSGRGSVDDDRVAFGSQYYGKPKTFFPKCMPDSGLPDGNDYAQKVPIPPSSNESSIHNFDVEGGYEADSRDIFHCVSDQERSSRSSSNRSGGNHNYNFANENFDYLKWMPDYGGQMAAVYAEIADFPDRSRAESQQNSSSSPSILFSKSSSQTTLPCIMPRHNGQGNWARPDVVQYDRRSQVPSAASSRR